MTQPAAGRAGAAVGLLAAGVAALVVAWVLGDDFAVPEPAPWWVRVATVVVVVLLAGLVWLRRSRPDDRAVPWTTLAVAVVALIIAVLAGWGFVDQYRGGFPGQTTILAALGGLAVAAGALLGRRTAGGWRRLPAAGAFLLVLVLAVPLMLVAPDVRVDATTAHGVKAAHVPATVSSVAWSTEVDEQVRDIVAAGTGVVLLLDDGVMAIDGPTGDVRWTRTRHGATAVRVDASPDGATVLVQYRPRDGFAMRREVVDAVTGQLRYTVDDVAKGAGRRVLAPMTNTSYIAANDDESEFYGYSLTDHRKLWTYPAPRGCWIKPDHSAQFTISTGLLLPIVCAGDATTELRYVLVDGTTGKVRWEHRMRWDEPSSDIDVMADLAPDGRFLAVDVYSPATGQAVIDTATGTAVPAPMPLALRTAGIGIRQPAGGESQLIDVTTGRQLASTTAIRACLSSNHGVSLESGPVCVDPALDSFDGLVDSGRIELAVGTLAGGELRSVPVTLGGPFDSSRLGDDEIRLVAAPGAVVVTTGMSPAEGGHVTVVGLR
jgi:hypothetical protein